MEQMQRIESHVRLSTHRSGVFDQNGREYVIVPGYHVSGWFGYFLCRETVIVNNNSFETVYLYSDASKFERKTDELAYQRALDEMQRFLTTVKKE